MHISLILDPDVYWSDAYMYDAYICDSWCKCMWCIYLWSLTLMYIGMMLTRTMRTSVILYPDYDGYMYDLDPWPGCIYACIHDAYIYMTLNPDACMYDAYMYITLDPDAYIYDPRSWCMHVWCRYEWCLYPWSLTLKHVPLMRDFFVSDQRTTGRTSRF